MPYHHWHVFRPRPICPQGLHRYPRDEWYDFSSLFPPFPLRHAPMPDSHCHILEYGASRQIPLSEGKTVEGKSLSRRHLRVLPCLPFVHQKLCRS